MADSTVGSGGTYSDLSTWEAATDNDLVSTTTIERALLLNQTFTLTAGLVVSGATTNSSYYREITTDAGASFVDNANVRTNALTFNTANGAAITSTTAYVQPLVLLGEGYARLTKLQIRTTASTSCAVRIGANTQVTQCIIDCNGVVYGGLELTNSGAVATNTLVIKRAATASRIALFSFNAYASNCTFVVPSGTAKATVGLRRDYPAAATFTNCAVFGATDFGGTTNTTYANCYGDDASPPSGVTQVAFDATTGSGFESVTADFRIKSTSALANAGTSTGAPSIDISGTARPQGASYDVGCWEYSAAASPASLPPVQSLFARMPALRRF